jgi:hypothetical protein
VDALEPYLAELRDIRASGATVPETSGYGALATLLNEIGRHLKPKVRCFINLANTGAGIPDGGLFVANQLQKGAEPLPGQVPQRGAIEVKAPSANAREVARGEQVAKYLEKYRQVLVTSYREFVLVGYDSEGRATPLESYTLAPSEAAFWTLAAQPRKAALTHGERLTEFLMRAMLRQAQIVAPQELAWFLASYAREARARVQEGGALPALTTTRQALEQALGMTFEGERGEHFFRSTLVQMLFYGLFAAWVFWAEQHEPLDTQARFRWREAAWYLHIPILSKLYGDFASPSQLGTMHLEEVLDWAGEALDRVDRASFFATFEQQHAVQYFYEPFLEAFDPELRRQLGVWYTPPEIVKYMVARVDQVLRSELAIADGLADPRVVVLDPCCGTGAYLVEVLNRIAKTMRGKGGDALIANDLKKAAMSRIFGFEILPAPFVISHLQIGLALDRFGAPFAENGKERAGVFLTNALTGWEPTVEPKQHLLFSELEMERDAAADVKQKKPILVILGNPPYNAFAGVSPDEEGDLVQPYKEGLVSQWGVRKFNLDELYVRFIRLGERRIAEAVGRGIVSFISSFSYLDGPSFVALRAHLLHSFHQLWFDNMNGDSRETGKTTPDGRPDPSVFSTKLNREGIQVGTTVAVMVRTDRPVTEAQVCHRSFWGPAKLAEIAACASGDQCDQRPYEKLSPTAANLFRLRPTKTSAGYDSWPRVVDLAVAEPSLGLLEKRGGALIDMSREGLAGRMKAYFDSNLRLTELPESLWGLKRDWARFDAAKTRKRLLASEVFDPEKIAPIVMKPMDVQWAYVDTTRPLWNEPRPRLVSQREHAGRFLLVRRRAPRADDGAPFLISASLCEEHVLNKDAYLIPMSLGESGEQRSDQIGLLPSSKSKAQANVSDIALAYLRSVECAAEDLWMHVLGTGYSPVYLHENADGIRHDWPRIPLPASSDALLASADLGRRVAALLDVESAVDAVTTGTPRCELRPLGLPWKADGDQIDPAAGDLAVTTGWGHAGQGGVTMPGQGRLVERAYTSEELATLREGLAELQFTFDQLMTCFGGTCVDIYLNDRSYWRCLPKRVWAFTIGGYPVIKKWLSYRERPLLGRDITVDEARYVTEMARRIAAVLLLEPALDANYKRVKADTYSWSAVRSDA